MLDFRGNFSVCSFMKSIYLIGGYLEHFGHYKGCYKYNLNYSKWTKIADLNIDRGDSACAVFEGKIVSTGGNRYSGITNSSAESYDYYENKWSRLPDMIGWRTNHSSFSMGNKFFVIGGCCLNYAEVFDSMSRKFTSLNLKLPGKNQYSCYCEPVNICKEMFVFCFCFFNKQPGLHVYNFDEKRWVFKEIVKSAPFRKHIIHKVPKQ